MKNFILGILLISFSAVGQEFNFSIHKTSLSENIQLEEALRSERIPTTSNHVSFSGETQPIKFLRKEKIIPDLIVYYFFKEKDSSMSYVLYEWDVYNFEKQDNNQKSKEFEDAFIRKYQDLKNKVSKDFGAPKTKSNYSNLARLDPEHLFEENSIWEPNDSTEIEMYITVSNYYEKKGAVTINPVHRIRLYIRSFSGKSNTSIPKVDSEKLVRLDKLTSDFFRALNSKDSIKLRDYLSELIKQKVTDEQLSLLRESIDFGRKLELIFNGIQMGFDGSSYTVLQYKYSDDKSSPPSEIIKVIIDNKDKIAGIQPVKLQTK